MESLVLSLSNVIFRPKTVVALSRMYFGEDEMKTGMGSGNFADFAFTFALASVVAFAIALTVALAIAIALALAIASALAFAIMIAIGIGVKTRNQRLDPDHIFSPRAYYGMWYNGENQQKIADPPRAYYGTMEDYILLNQKTSTTVMRLSANLEPV